MLGRFFQANPMVRLLLPFLVGILVGNSFSVPLFWSLGLSFLFFALYFLFCFLNLSSRIVYGILISCTFFCLGIFLVHFRVERYRLPKNLTTHFVKAVVIEKEAGIRNVLDRGPVRVAAEEAKAWAKDRMAPDREKIDRTIESCRKMKM